MRHQQAVTFYPVTIEQVLVGVSPKVVPTLYQAFYKLFKFRIPVELARKEKALAEAAALLLLRKKLGALWNENEED